MNAAQQLGSRLRGAREERQLTIADVTHLTRIQAHLIEALEAGDYTAFSSLAYAKSFLSQYSGFLGVDAHDLLGAFAPADPLFNLDAYDYLKPHDLHVRHKPQEIITPVAEDEQTPAREGIGLQALALLLITGLLAGTVAYAVRTVEQHGAPEVLAAIQAFQALQQAAQTPSPPPAPPEQNTTVASTANPGDPVADTILTTTAPRAIIVREP